MAKFRMINTKFWSDNWITNLDPVEKLLFLYLLTNERTNIAGVYELPLKIMAVETGIEKEMIEKIFSRFETDKKVIYKQGWVHIVNFIKHQDMKNEKIKKGVELALQSVPKDIKDTLLIGYVYPSKYSNSNSNSNSNSKLPKGRRTPKPPKQDYTIINNFLKEIQDILDLPKWADCQRWTRVYAQKCLTEYDRDKTLEAVKWMKLNWNSKPTKMKTIFYGIRQYDERNKPVKSIDLSNY